MQKLIQFALIATVLSASTPSIALASSHTDTLIAAAIGGAAGALLANNIRHQDRYSEQHEVRRVYIAREQPVEQVYYVQPGYRPSVYYYEAEPRYYNYRHRHAHGRYHDDDD